MSMKIKTCYSKINITKGVFNGAEFDPTMINFIFGKNGSGKTTISRAFQNGSLSSDWAPGIDRSDVKVMVYNEDFINDNIQSYGNIPGVFTITKQSAEDKAKIDARNKDLRSLNGKIQKQEDEIRKAESEMKDAEDKYYRKLWDATATIRRNDFPDTQVGYKNGMAKLAARLEDTSAINHDEKELKQLYETLFVRSVNPDHVEHYANINPQSVPSTELLGKQIVGLSDTPFADFVKKLGALDWVTEGHNKFHNSSSGKCPYCQQTLPPDFENKLAACYDEEYKRDLERLNHFVSHYQDAIETIRMTIDKNSNNDFNTPLKNEYLDVSKQLIDRLSYNWTTIQLKLASPGTAYEIEEVSDLISKVNKVTKEINDKIDAYNALLADIPGKKRDCTEKVFQYMAFACRDIIAERKGARDVEQSIIDNKADELEPLNEQKGQLEDEIHNLSQMTVNTTAVKDSINSLIRNSGFQGFHLREKPGAQYVYELVRTDDQGRDISIAKGLSEGERHFIAFLYFYHTVIGSQSDDGRVVPKIVVIDDPVSSLDSEALFIVAALTRELIGICYNNYKMTFEENREDYIKQFFCLTHNPYFFREISYTMLPEYECASFFEIKKKDGNRSTIEPCTEKSTEVGRRIINRNPVRSHYDSLWADLKTEDDPETLMMIIRQILEYYFIQMCGYKTGNLRRDLIDRNESRFVQRLDDGSTDRTDYVLASAMISLLDSGANGFNDGLYFNCSSADPDNMRSVFHRIFKLQGQEQHYYMMLGE